MPIMASKMPVFKLFLFFLCLPLPLSALSDDELLTLTPPDPLHGSLSFVWPGGSLALPDSLSAEDPGHTKALLHLGYALGGAKNPGDIITAPQRPSPKPLEPFALPPFSTSLSLLLSGLPLQSSGEPMTWYVLSESQSSASIVIKTKRGWEQGELFFSENGGIISLTLSALLQWNSK